MRTSTITFFGIKATRALEREIERRLEKWIRRERQWLSGGQPWTYSIEIERDGSPHLYHCSLQIFGKEEWTSHGSGKTLHAAITNALRNIQTSSAISVSSDSTIGTSTMAHAI